MALLLLLLLCAAGARGGSGKRAAEESSEAADEPLLTAPPPSDFLASTLSEMATADAAVSQQFPGLLVSSSTSECEAYVAEALRWAPCNGLLMRTKHDPEASPGEAGTAFSHAPFALLPAEFPASELQRACDLAPIFGRLVDAVASDLPWLEHTLRETAASDEFTRRLLRLCSKVTSEGLAQQACLGVLRSDYMLHEPLAPSNSPADANAVAAASIAATVIDSRDPAIAAAEVAVAAAQATADNRNWDGGNSAGGDEAAEQPPAPRLLQVELNTIASSFASLSCKVSDLHRSLAQKWPALRAALWERRGQPRRLAIADALPPNGAVDAIAEALARAHREYGMPEAAVLFVVQPNERNVIDQQLLAQALFDQHGVQVIYRTLTQIEQFSRLEGPKRRLNVDGVEISVVYFRAGYVPEDYPSQREWSARLTVERSLAIKCPTAAYQLAGAKKVQQALSVPGELERFISAKEAEAARQVFAGLWSLSGSENPSENASLEEREAAEAMRRAIIDPSGFVMKPQREGGGHNLFGEALRAALKQLTRAQRSAYILMQKIEPKAFPGILVRSGEVYRGQTISELGVYSTFLKSKTG